MFVYIVPLKNNSAFKVGSSRSPKTRMRDLLLSHELDLDRCKLVKCGSDNAARRLEAMLLDTLLPHRCGIVGPGGSEFFDIGALESLVDLVTRVAILASYEVKALPKVTPPQTVSASKEESVARHIANALRTRRLALNIKRADLSTACGVPLVTIKRAEAGKRFSSVALIRLCLALGLNEELLAGEPKKVARQRAK